jgi:hypothetical protein
MKITSKSQIFFIVILSVLIPMSSVDAKVRYSRAPFSSTQVSPVTVEVSFDDFEADTQLLIKDCPTWSIEISDNNTSYFPKNAVSNSVNTGKFVVDLPSKNYTYIAFSCGSDGGGAFIEGDSSTPIFYGGSGSHFTERVSVDATSLPQTAPTTVNLISPIPSTELFVSITETLSRGSRGTQVTLLQGFLKILKFFPSNTAPTGYFGSITETAVMSFQESRGIEPIGIVGPKTRKAIADYRGGSI